MDYKSLFKTEILFKVLSKGIGFGKSLILLFLFGFTKELDSYYLALSLTGIMLSIPVVFELLYMAELKDKIESNKLELLQNLGLQFLVVTAVCSFLSIIVVTFFYHEDVLKNVIILLLWAFFFNLNSFIILVLRIRQQYKAIGWYFFFFPLITSIVLVLAFYGFNFKNAIIASLSMLVSEIILVFFLKHKVRTKLFFAEKIKLSFVFNKKRFSQIIKSFSLISAVYVIDVTDKSFSYNLDGGYTTVLIYGSLVPLMVRQALDFKSVFYHRLQYSYSIQSDLQIFYKTLKWLVYIIAPIMIVLYIGLQFVELSLLNKFIDINNAQFYDLIQVVYIYILILPIYIVWDMMYRIYYKNDYLNNLFLIMLIGVVLNYVLNYMFVNYLFMKTSGIALSTFIVLFLYCSYSFGLLKIKELRELNKNRNK